MSRTGLSSFFEQFAQQDRGQGFFELEQDKVLEVNLGLGGRSLVWTKLGSMVAYRGQVTFKREGMLEQGLGSLLKKSLTGEGASLTKAEGSGKVYLADSGKLITVLNLSNESLVVNGNDVLAFGPTLKHSITMMRKMAAALSGGLFNVRFEGTGLLAITTHGKPLVLKVTPDSPLVTDPNATIAWSGTLAPDLQVQASLGAFLGRGSGESLQMMFRGEGYVVVQPYEEVAMQRPS